MATLSIKPGLRCTVPDWMNVNNELSVIAEQTRHLSHEIRLEGRALCNDTANKTTWGEYDSNRRLNDRISDITLWRKRLETCAEELDTEMDALTLTKEAAERALSSTVLPLEVTSECLTLREGRRGNELVSDPVEAELKKEVEVIHKAQQVLQQSIDQAFKQLCLLQEARHQLTLDLQHKTEALDVDMSCLSLSVTSSEISLKPNPIRVPPGSTTPQQWMQFSQHNISQAKEEMQASLHLRENINITIAQVQNELESQRIATQFASRKRTHQLEQAHQELQWQIKSTQDEINELKEDVLRLERDVQSKMAPLKLVHTRLQYRTRRPGMDLCRDEVQNGLLEENKQLALSIVALKQKLAQAQQKLRQALGGQVVLPDDWETTAEVIRETGRKVLGVSSGRRKEDKETWWWNEEVQDSIQRKRLAKKKWDMDRTEENRQENKELQRRVKREVSKAKQKAYDELYTRLDTREGEKDLYRLARQRDRDGKDVQQVRVIKDRDGRVLTSEGSVQRRWKEYFEELMNEENEREKRVEGVNSVEQKVDKIRKDEVRKALKRMKSGKAVGPDDIPVEVWKCLGEAAVEFLTNLFNRVLESERMPEEWRRSVLVPIFKNKGDVQSCSNYRRIKLMSHTMKVWERVVEARLRKVVEICEQQYGFMPRKSTTDAIFALRILMEKYRDGQRELHCVFVDLEKAYDRVPREELWYCMRKSGVAEKYVRVVQDMYERSRTVVRCAVGQTEEFKVEVGLHQGSALSPFLFAIVMDQLSEEVRQESPWTMMFADDIVICSESREQVEENLERWRFALERRGMKVSRSKTEYMCVNEREGSGTVRDSLQVLQLHEARMLQDLERKQEALSLEQRSMQTRQRLNSAPNEFEPSAVSPLTNSSGMHKLQLKYTA
ncbi:hypothetical protein QTP86_023307 [Hemibagrus guttatus]|nr:hypothetical protein QTP86_023307 [Hemibagrus guttatus]